MNKTIVELEILYSDANKDPLLKKRLLETRSAGGYNQCKSTNGGNPYPYESFEDPYETFLASLWTAY